MAKIKIREEEYQKMCDIFDEMELHTMNLESRPEDIHGRTLKDLSYFIIFFLWCDSELEETPENAETLREMRRMIRENVEFIS